MPLPWLRILDTLVNLTTLARGTATRPDLDEPGALAPGSRALGHFVEQTLCCSAIGVSRRRPGIGPSRPSH